VLGRKAWPRISEGRDSRRVTQVRRAH